MQDRSDDELKKGLEAQATLINAEREVGVRAVVELVRNHKKAQDEYTKAWNEYHDGHRLDFMELDHFAASVSAAQAELEAVLALYSEQQ